MAIALQMTSLHDCFNSLQGANNGLERPVFNTITCELIGTDLYYVGTRLLFVDEFRFIQSGMKDVLEYKGNIDSKSHGRRSRNDVNPQVR